MISFVDIQQLKSKADVERFIRDCCRNDPLKFITEINATVNELLQTDLKQARRFIDYLTPCFRHLPKYHRPRLLAIEARYAHNTGQSKTALRKYKTAVSRLHEVRNFDAAARARQGLMDVHMYLGQYEMALQVGRQALNYFRRKGNEYNAARVMTNIGNVYHRMDRNRLALRYYNRARKYFEPAAGVPLAILDYNRANIFANLNQLNQAEALYESVAESFRRNKMDLAVGKAEYSLAYLYFLADRYTTALTTFDRVTDTFRDSGDNRSVAITKLDLAEINTHLNQFGSAVMLGQQALDACKEFGLGYEQGKAAYFVAEAYRRLGDNAQASRYLRLAERLFVREDNKLWQGMVNLARCRIKTASKRFDEALIMANSARHFFGISGDERRQTDADITLVEIHLASGRPDKALQLAGRLSRRKLVSYQRHIVYDLMGICYMRRSQPQKALKFFKRAIEIIERMLINIYPDEIRFFFALDKYPTYLSAVTCLLQLNRVEESFLQHSQALAVLNQRCVPRLALRREVPDHLLEARTSLRASLKKLSLPPDPSQRQLTGPGTMQREEHRLWDIERKIRSYLYPTEKKHRLPIISDRSYPNRIRASEILISFVSADTMLGAFVTQSGSNRYVPFSINRDELETMVRELHFLMENAVYAPGGGMHSREVTNHYLRQLHDILIAPMNLSRKKERLMLVLDGPFSQIPFQALRGADGSWLKDNYDIRIIVNPEDLTRTRAGRFSGNGRSAIFAPANAGLPLVETEGHKVKGSFQNARLYTGENASISNLTAELDRASGFVHIATHASRSSENPLFSQILMSDGPFFPFDLFGTGIRAQLVSLSGCQTAAPGIYYGNSFSLARAFYQAGARHVLASLWPISDKVGMVFMGEFYFALKADRDISVAYRTAVNNTATINDDPAFWGPFVLLGI
jgi:CHAT domain-containing protein/tetratricopeptide (TPR) repeat protein